MLQVQGMSCSSCVSVVERALQAVPGVSSAAVNLLMKRAEVRHRGVKLSLLLAAVEDVGFQAELLQEVSQVREMAGPNMKTMAKPWVHHGFTLDFTWFCMVLPSFFIVLSGAGRVHEPLQARGWVMHELKPPRHVEQHADLEEASKCIEVSSTFINFQRFLMVFHQILRRFKASKPRGAADSSRRAFFWSHGALFRLRGARTERGGT